MNLLAYYVLGAAMWLTYDFSRFCLGGRKDGQR